MSLKESIVECPFCKDKNIKVVEKPSYRGFKTSRGSGRSDTYSVNVRGEIIVLNGCFSCRKGVKEIEKALFG
jgi:hypothetical protein